MFAWSLVSLCTVSVLSREVLTVTITVRNNCPWQLWPATMTGAGGAQLPDTGFTLNPGQSRSIEVPSTWTAGRIWARTQCDSPNGVCVTGDCGSGAGNCDGRGGAPPATLAEFTLNANGQDYYDISNVDGFNIPLSIAPQGGSGDRCVATSCAFNINTVCPEELAVRTNDGVVGCKSACVAFGEPQYCCSGDHSTPDTCPPTSYSRIFKDRCPQAYSYAYDDTSSTFICSGQPNYAVTFCP